jgi:NAD(P)H-nitrite reductase large subunit
LPHVNNLKTLGTSCGGCLPIVSNIFKHEMESSGKKVNDYICEHFNYNRPQLYQIIQVLAKNGKKLDTFALVLESHGNPGAGGCEICKPAIASILGGLFNDHILSKDLAAIQDTNDRYLGNVQKGIISPLLLVYMD